MGQWGALGSALAGTGFRPILSHYYGGTSLAGLSTAHEATQVRVALTENDGNTVIVTSGSAFTVPAAGLDVGAGQAVLMSPAGAGRWNLWVGPGCGGPWPATPTATEISDPTADPGADPGLGAAATASQALQLCQGGGNLTVRGSLEALFNSTVRHGPSTPSRSSSTSRGSSPTSPRPVGARSAGPVRRASRGDSRSSRPRPWRPAPT